MDGILKFRPLRADEIDVRVQQCTERGVCLLLYKDARCDQNMLDETVGAGSWQRVHEVVNGNLFCSVGIRIRFEDGTTEWVWKQDVGTESNTEKVKGEASDSFKRACFNWGIGRELYTAPFIWIGASGCRIERTQKGYVCRSRFKVKKLESMEGRITALTITDQNGKEVYTYRENSGRNDSERTQKAPQKEDKPTPQPITPEIPIPTNAVKDSKTITDEQVEMLRAELARTGRSEIEMLIFYHVDSLSQLTITQFIANMNNFRRMETKAG